MPNPPERAPDPASGLRSLGQQAVEEIYRGLFQDSHDGEYVLDVAMDRFLMVNDAFARMTGYPRETLCGPGFTSLSIIAPEQHEQVLKRRQSLGAETYEVKVISASKEVRNLEVSVRRLEFHNRVVTLGSARDVTDRKQSEERLRESEEQFRRLSEATTEGIALQEKGRILFVNRTLAALYGYAPSELIGRDLFDLVAPESRDLVARRIQAADEQPYEAVALRKDGSTFPYEVRGKSMPYQGRTVRVAAIRDISAVRQMSAALERQVRLEKKKTLEAFQANVRIFQLTEKIRAAYESTTHLVNSRNVEELLGSAVKLLCDPAGLDYREALLYLSREGGLELLASHPEQAPVCIPHDADHPAARAARGGAPQSDPGGLVLPLKGQAGVVGVLEVRFHNAEEVRSWQENILRTLANSLSLMVDNLNLYEMVRRQSITDVLTGVHNRRYFDEKLLAEVERAVRYKREMTLVMIDLDDFKRINDDPRGGHMQGDDVLREIGLILRKQSRQIDMVCRYGGDEFTLILPETGLANAVRHADRLREIIAAKAFANRLDPQRPFRLTASLGVADVDARRCTSETVLGAADQAAFLAKREGKNRVKSSEDL
jgi:diguanylate cyclase (GGDEF)-like protein/PAS domain S-box-containing protein